MFEGFLPPDVASFLNRGGCGAYFNSYCFLFGFLPPVLAIFWLLRQRHAKLAFLAFASLVFYSFYDVRFTALILAAAVIDFIVAIRLEKSEGAAKKRWLLVSVVFNLGILAVFKYAMFAAANARGLLEFFGSSYTIPGFYIVLPAGISFFTFKTMSYTIDVYRGEVAATRDLLKYVTFVSLFPEMVAGPIVRYRVLDKQLDELPVHPRLATISTGFWFLAIGLFKKVAIADPVARAIDPIWSHPAASFADAWTAALGYTVQLYFDFSGYSDMAVGLGALLGLALPINFRAPYQARNPSDFWQRWHITLSTFLRDYLYIPLGGNRKGPVRTYVNLLIVMLLGGLWHGAAWTFVVWGGYHGLLLVLHRRFSSLWDAMPILLQRGGMLFLAVIGWVFFRAVDLRQAFRFLGAMAGVGQVTVPHITWFQLLLVASALAFAAFAKPMADRRFTARVSTALLIASLYGISLLLIGEEPSPFLYYQF